MNRFRTNTQKKNDGQLVGMFFTPANSQHINNALGNMQKNAPKQTLRSEF